MMQFSCKHWFNRLLWKYMWTTEPYEKIKELNKLNVNVFMSNFSNKARCYHKIMLCLSLPTFVQIFPKLPREQRGIKIDFDTYNLRLVSRVGLCIISLYISCIDTLALWYILYNSFYWTVSQMMTFCLYLGYFGY